MLQSETDVSRTPNCRSQRSTSPFITVLTRRSAIGTKKKKKMEKKMEQAFVWPWKSHNWATFLAISMFAFLLRMLVSLHSYSGAAVPPKYGDYEAQRHWMEITVHTPVKQWYQNTTDNDLRYWGLDYPPLTAYQSFVHGIFLNAVEPAAVALHTSRGYENTSSKLLMRWTVLSSDILVFFPAVLVFVALYYRQHANQEQAWALAMILLQPALMLIDHGHFQYNCISLGLAVGAAAAVIMRQELMACILFSLSLNHKQMSTYYAPAFFAHLLGRCFQCRSPVVGVMRLGVMVLATFAVCWWPFLSSWQSVLQVLSRLAPLERGLYEDYVANFWCSTSLLVKWKQLFSIPMLARLAMGMTIGASLPSMVQQILAPSAEGFLFSMLNSSFAFYLFAFQVHEKSVLLPVLPATLLALNEPQVLQYIVPIAVMSMLPLLRRDGLIIPYFALLSLFFLLPAHPVYGPQGKPNKQKGSIVKSSALNLLPFCSISGAVVLHLIYLFLHPPARYPFLFEALITVYCFVHFLALAIYTNWRQWFQPVDRAEVSADKEE
ncbi:hypothetical protein BDL97_02G113800 [Sphagnum fallax]|nr:hypothetical protein BDL97_02G113800 [Sphagnum fallax]KAH8970920.1 hypothetical protein BDL97_02G113800 [Sphagnum fallax]KAH8970921.1 hypothetical protein BDL97_02G113800 [Sphagnum fallax]